MWRKASLQLARVVSRERRGGWRCYYFEKCQYPSRSWCGACGLHARSLPSLCPLLLTHLLSPFALALALPQDEYWPRPHLRHHCQCSDTACCKAGTRPALREP